MTLADLALALRAQAKARGAISLDPTVLVQPLADAISAAFMLGQGHYLTAAGMAEQSIPDPVGQELRIHAGAAALLNIADVEPQILFWTDASDQVQCAVDIALPPTWRFADSFPGRYAIFAEEARGFSKSAIFVRVLELSLNERT